MNNELIHARAEAAEWKYNYQELVAAIRAGESNEQLQMLLHNQRKLSDLARITWKSVAVSPVFAWKTAAQEVK